MDGLSELSVFELISEILVTIDNFSPPAFASENIVGAVVTKKYKHC